MSEAEYNLFITAVCMWFGSWRTWATMSATGRKCWYAEHWRVSPNRVALR